MQIQELIFPAEDRGCPGMFYRGGRYSDGGIILRDGETLSLDTYFNSFSYTKYRDFTRVEEVCFTLNIRGAVRGKLMVYTGAEEICAAEGSSENGVLTLTAKLSALPEKGFLYPTVTADGDAVITGGGYFSECDADSISVCIAICTFRREQFVLKNIELLRSCDFSVIDRLFVVDNGNTLDREALSDDFVTVLYNKNYGGSGGFTRGMIEASDGGYSHVLLMDDDVELYPQVLERMTVFLSLLREEHSSARFSAAMLFLSEETPYLQWEMGGGWTGHCIESRKHRVDIRDRDVLLDDLDNDDVHYGAWWCLCIPVSEIRENGLSMPFFIKLDDVEHGLRCNDGTPIITMNGAAIFHESFEKKMNMALDYYTIRNELVTAAIHGSSARDAVKLFIYSAGKHILLYRYDNIPLIFKAVRDFMGGVDFFLKTDEEQLNNELRKSSPAMRPLKDIPEWNDALLDNAPSECRKGGKLKGFAANLLPCFLLKKEITAVAIPFASPEDFTLRRGVIQYQLAGDSGILTKRSFGKFLKYGFLTAFLALKLMFSFGRLAQQYTARQQELCSFEFWRKHLDL